MNSLCTLLVTVDHYFYKSAFWHRKKVFKQLRDHAKTLIQLLVSNQHMAIFYDFILSIDCVVEVLELNKRSVISFDLPFILL